MDLKPDKGPADERQRARDPARAPTAAHSLPSVMLFAPRSAVNAARTTPSYRRSTATRTPTATSAAPMTASSVRRMRGRRSAAPARATATL